jgi:phosphoribosylpyrophosphate synthetase
MAITTLLLASLLAGAASPSALQPNPQSLLVSHLTTGSYQQRLDAANRALRVSPDLRSDELNRALAAELERVNALIDKRRRLPGVIDTEWDTYGLGEYLGVLVEANARTGQPLEVSLPGLVGALGTGKMATDAVAHFGGVALSSTLALLQDTDAPALARSGAAIAIGTMLRGGRLNNAQRIEVASAARALLTRTQSVSFYGTVIDLAAMTGDLSLLGVLQQIAANPSSALPGPITSADAARLQGRAKKALSQSPR